MITENAIVISVSNNQTWIETQRKSVCGQCSASKGCGTSVLSKVVGNKLSTMKAINKIDAKVGDEVIVGLNEKSLLKGAFMTYLLPLFFLFFFSLIGQFISTIFVVQNNEFLVIFFAIVGFFLGLRYLKKFSSTIEQDEEYYPIILKKTHPSSIFVNR